ncbi:8-oxo-dGTP pyrophosphatase MutT (NUDIX family) [Crossiella equi]|uniref:8-oxo-dGTP pyrophosphatase MutT (NUDIX family) n=1 Tax=Crossiella equi TaxID=130796 RepID=A0ABS5AA57_9PSEU|nr:NUDIX hydrolase [Crossiella equi]MBP2473465.1 8-oxo-dGTP pyrophosphatase MutT (NUDIX family) [Crossiella equi]
MNRADANSTPSYDPSLGLAGLPTPPMWVTAGQRSLYRSPWVSLELVSVKPPTAPAYEHHMTRVGDAVALVLEHPEHGVLMLHRHRFVTESVGLELPAGGIDEGEDAVTAALREAEEETGWTAGQATAFLCRAVSDGWTTQRFHFVHARAERFLGTPHNLDEGHAVWVRHRDLLHVLAGDEVVCGPSQLGLLHAITFDLLRAPVRAGSVQAREQG